MPRFRLTTAPIPLDPMSLTLSCLVLISQTASAQPHTGIHVAPAHAPVPPAVAAASTPPVDLCYRFDDRVAETAVGATPGNSFDSLNINAFQAPAGGDTITTLELQTFGDEWSSERDVQQAHCQNAGEAQPCIMAWTAGPEVGP